MISFRNLFRFSQKEVSFTFDHILDKQYYRGLKLLKSSPPTVDLPHGKLLIITPRAAGKSHERNLIRRQLKNIFFQEQCYLAPFIWIVIVSPKAKTISFDALKKFLVTTTQAHPTPPIELP